MLRRDLSCNPADAMLIQIRCNDMSATLIFCFHVCCFFVVIFKKTNDAQESRPPSLLKLRSRQKKKQHRFVSSTRNPPSSFATLPFQTCLRLQSLLQTRAGWRPAGWRMERRRRWRGASTAAAAAAAASGGEARDKDTATVRAALRVTLISHRDAASLEYKTCDNARCTAALSPPGRLCCSQR